MNGEQYTPEDRVDKEYQKLDARIEKTERRTEEAIHRTELASQRTEWAERRTLLANERTFSAWLRTGLTSIGGGLAVARLLGGGGIGDALAQVVGVILVLAGGAVGVLGLWRFIRVSQILRRERLPILPLWVAWLLAGSLVVVAVLVLLMILLG